MNEREKEVCKAQLKDEEKALKELRLAYNKARADVKKQISALNARQDMQNLQTIVHQKRYQKALLKQIEGVLDDLKKGQYKTFEDFFQGSYMNGYLGSMYNLQGQGIPMTVPIDPKKMERAIKIDSKLSKSYYLKRQIPENIERMKKSIRVNVTRGIASGKTWVEVAYQIAEGMNSPVNRAMSDAMRIVRTEGHRVNQQGFVDAGDEAKAHGADILKQWDATLDSRTRPWHQEADGQIREWEDDFLVHGEKMKAPSIGGSASNVINCRCQLLQRARWMLDEDELKTLEERAKFYGLDKTKNFEEYKEKFLNIPEVPKTAFVKKLPDLYALDNETLLTFVKQLDNKGVEYREVKLHPEPLSDEDIIKALAGGDLTKGSCASVGLCYIGQVGGVDVKDFRDGKSRDFFATTMNLKALGKLPKVKMFECSQYKTSVANGFKLLQQCELGKKYYFVNGCHASIVRRTGEGKEDFEYLELQSPYTNGWKPMHHEFSSKWGSHVTTVRDTLKNRFGQTTYDDVTKRTFMFDVDSMKDSDELKKILGYINTADDKQRKGKSGQIR